MNDKDKILELIYSGEFELANQLTKSQDIKINTTEINNQLESQISEFKRQYELINKSSIETSKKIDKVNEYRNHIVKNWILENIEGVTDYSNIRYMYYKDLQKTWQDDVVQYKKILSMIDDGNLIYYSIKYAAHELTFNQSVIDQINKLIS